MTFLGRFALALLVVSVSYVAPLRLVNPEGDFRESLLPPIVVDARAWKMSQLRASDVRAYDALVFGSSRSMQLGPQLATRFGVHAYNFAVDNAHVEDYLALYHWSKRIGIVPRLLTIGLDLEALHDSDVTDERYSRDAELVGALGDRSAVVAALDSAITELQKYKRMFTTWYVTDAVHSVRVRIAPALPPETEVIRADGVLGYPRWEAERAAGTFDLEREIAACLPLYVDRFKDMRALSSWRLGLLEQLLTEARADGVGVVMWLTPLHEGTIARLTQTTDYPRLVRLAAQTVGDLAARYGARFRDLSEPASFGASATGWYDCAHVDPSNLERLSDALRR